MRTGGGLVALGLAVSAAASAAPARAPEILLSEGGVLEAKKPLTIGVMGDRGSVFVEARVLPDAAIARLYRDAVTQGSGRARASSVGKTGVPANRTEVRLVHRSHGAFTAAVDLRPLIGERRGVVVVDAFEGSERTREVYQVTDLGLLLVRSPIRSVVQVLRLSTGAPVGGATILTLDPRGQFVTRGTTDAGGLLTLDATADDLSLPADGVLLARTSDGDQVVLLPPRAGSRLDDGVDDRDAFPPRILDLVRGERIEAALFTDRRAYQHGERIQVAGWAAAASAVHPDGLRPLPSGSRLRLTLTRIKTTLATTDVALTPQGKLTGTLSIPGNAPLGDADVRLELPLADGKERVLETRTVRIEAVTAQAPAIELHADRHELVRPDEAHLTVVDPTGRTDATASLRYEMACEPIWQFHPAGVPDGWVVGDSMQKPIKVAGVVSPPAENSPDRRISFSVSTRDAPPDATSWCRVKTTTSKSGGGDRTAEAILLVHPRSFYVAVHIAEPPRNRRVTSTLVTVRAVSTAGAPVALAGATIELDQDRSGALVPGSRRPLDLSRGQATVDLSLPAAKDGRAAFYSVVVRDAGGHLLSRDYLSGLCDEDAVTMHAPSVVLPGASFKVAIDKGDKQPGAGMLAIQGGGVQRALPVPVGRGIRAELSMVAGESYFPGVKLEAAVAHPHRDAPAELAWLWTESEVPKSTRALEVAVDGPKVARASDHITLRAGVRRLEGKPIANIHVAVAVVSEAVLSRDYYAGLATNFYFLHHRQDESRHWDMFGDIVKPFVVTDDWHLRGRTALSSSGIGCSGFEPRPPAPESRWRDATVAFLPDIAADARGDLTATFVAPATPGLYRVQVVAAASLPAGAPGYFGSGNAWIDVR